MNRIPRRLMVAGAIAAALVVVAGIVLRHAPGARIGARSMIAAHSPSISA